MWRRAEIGRRVATRPFRLFDAAQVLSLARRVGIPVVFDWLHHQANPCREPLNEVLPAIFATWTRRDGIRKVHLSSQARGARPGAHADYIEIADAMALLDGAPPVPFDCMLEAKQKDRALLRLRRDLARRRILESAVPPTR